MATIEDATVIISSEGEPIAFIDYYGRTLIRQTELSRDDAIDFARFILAGAHEEDDS